MLALKRLRYALAAALALSATLAMAQSPDGYRAAKRIVDSIYHDYPVTTYCGCIYNGKEHDIDADSCGLDVDKYANRAERVEWEHVMPASYFGHRMDCWHNAPEGTSGREYCGRVSSRFRHMAGDLVNLQPSVGALNAIRSNHPYGMIEGEKREFGECDFEDDGDVTEPPLWFRGDAARIWFYMSDTYDIPIEDEQRAMFERWAENDPPDEWERVRARRIGKIQGREYTIQFGN